jgi:Ca2+-binding EF-hand superfamily protein
MVLLSDGGNLGNATETDDGNAATGLVLSTPTTTAAAAAGAAAPAATAITSTNASFATASPTTTELAGEIADNQPTTTHTLERAPIGAAATSTATATATAAATSTAAATTSAATMAPPHAESAIATSGVETKTVTASAPSSGEATAVESSVSPAEEAPIAAERGSALVAMADKLFELLASRLDGNKRLSGKSLQPMMTKCVPALPNSTLSNVWKACDRAGAGSLDKEQVVRLLACLGQAQAGNAVDPDAWASAPLPTITGLSAPTTAPATLKRVAAAISLTSPASTTLEEMADSLFAKLASNVDANGRIGGKSLQPVMTKCVPALPRSVLSKVWTACDKTSAGSLDKEQVVWLLACLGQAQAGNAVDPDAWASAPLPTITGLSTVEPAVLTVPTIDAAVTKLFKLLAGLIDESGRLSATALRPVMNKCSPPVENSMLKKIWSVCDTGKLGKLSRTQVASMFGYLSQVQAGETPNPKRLSAATPPPKITGLSI